MIRRKTVLMLFIFALAGTASPGSPIINPYVFKHATPSPPPPDTTAPILLSALVDVSGTVLTLVFSEPVADPDWTADVELDGAPLGVVFTYADGNGSNSIVFTTPGGHGHVVHKADELSLQITSGTIQDTAGNTLDAVPVFPVLNNSTQ